MHFRAAPASDRRAWPNGVAAFRAMRRRHDEPFLEIPIAPAITQMGIDCREGLVKTSTHLFFSGIYGAPTRTNHIVDVEHDTPTVRSVDALSTITHIAGYDAALFILGTDANGNGGIVRYDIATSTFSTLLAPGAYAIDAVDVSASGESRSTASARRTGRSSSATSRRAARPSTSSPRGCPRSPRSAGSTEER